MRSIQWIRQSLTVVLMVSPWQSPVAQNPEATIPEQFSRAEPALSEVEASARATLGCVLEFPQAASLQEF